MKYVIGCFFKVTRLGDQVSICMGQHFTYKNEE